MTTATKLAHVNRSICTIHQTHPCQICQISEVSQASSSTIDLSSAEDDSRENSLQGVIQQIVALIIQKPEKAALILQEWIRQQR